MENLIKEYPRPQFVREEWLNLNGEWQFNFDDDDEGLKQKWYQNFPDKMKIQVPFAFQAKLSGIHDPSFHDIVWYKKDFKIPETWLDQRIVLHFGAVDYETKVYVNSELVGEHIGGNSSFSFDITDQLQDQNNSVVVRVKDPSQDMTIPRGKQYWHEESASIFYTRTTGIWQTVWLEPVPETSIEKCRFTPHVDEGTIQMEMDIDGEVNQHTKLALSVSFRGQEVIRDDIFVISHYINRSYDLRNRITDRSNIHDDGWYWTPEHPNLFDVTLTLIKETKVLDDIKTYFGMRKVSIDDGIFKLNNKTFYQKLILDQGYFKEGLLTAPSDDALKKDILLAKEMGFNGARKHQKVEDPRFYYWADKLGFIVWGEMANCSEFSEDAVERMNKEWIDIIKRDYNHPSLIVWVPINESWGVSRIALEKQQQDHSLGMYYLTKSLDQTRPVMSNEGWEHTKSDVCGIHNYLSSTELHEMYQTKEAAVTQTPADRLIYAKGYQYNNEPLMITEYGGIAYEMDQEHKDQNWGYSHVQSSEALIEEYRKQTEAIAQSPVIQGFCYTQLCDVEQEINGLLTYDREPKCDLRKIKEINDSL